ncbi:MAG TPA: DUF3187 family protein, partial [Leptospiraceae bacterium]|nr:DUF3187 family protein [Leptospiraceae bacterium]HNE11530.1 DUF3187 family protein [Leptospiraceae bacterium]
SNMIDNNNAQTDYAGYTKYKPLFWSNYSDSFFGGRLTPLSYYLSEYFNYGSLEQQSHLKLDAEVERFHTKLSYGLFENFEIGFEITALSYNSGIFDGGINAYHRAVAIPYPLRDIYPNDQFAFSITDNHKPLVQAKPRTGLGDSVIDSKWRFLTQNNWIPTLAWVNTIKIPTGNSNYYMSSGKSDLATGFSAKWNFSDFFHFLNVFFVNTNDPFYSRDVKVKPYAAASYTIGYTLTEKFSAVTQIEYKGSPYHSSIQMINQSPVLWSFGFNWKIINSCSLRGNLTEDPITRTVPDISFQSSILCISE